MEDIPQHGRCGEPEDSGMQGGATACVRHQSGVEGGLKERLNPLKDAIDFHLHGDMERGTSSTVHPKRCVSSTFGKCALITEDKRIFLRRTKNCAPCPRSSRCCIGVGVRIMFGGGGLINNENIL